MTPKKLQDLLEVAKATGVTSFRVKDGEDELEACFEQEPADQPRRRGKLPTAKEIEEARVRRAYSSGGSVPTFD